MKKIFIICLLFTASTLFAQNKGSIKGKVLDIEMNNEPILFAQVHLKGSANNTETNFHGNFEINNLDAGAYTVVISYIGYDTIEVPVIVEKNNITTIKEGLKVKTINMEDFSSLNDIDSNVVTYEASSTEKK